LANFLKSITDKENINSDAESLDLIAEIASGSVRDALSMLDQVQFLCEQNLQIDQVRSMLGISSQKNSFQLLEKIIDGDSSKALKHLRELFGKNISSAKILSNLLNSCHSLTTALVANDELRNVDSATAEIFNTLKARVDVSILSRCWQMLLKGVSELKIAPDQNKALEMIVTRISFLEKNFDFKNILSNSNQSNDSDSVKKKHIA
jgi:DNA polymerase-3 subunit gamma/tau